MSLKQQLIQRMKDNADAARQQRDAEWNQYTTRPDMLFAVLEDPEITTPPSKWDRHRILEEVTKGNKMNSDDIVNELKCIVLINEQTGNATNDKLQDIGIALDNIARSQETIAKALVFITGVLDQRL